MKFFFVIRCYLIVFFFFLLILQSCGQVYDDCSEYLDTPIKAFYENYGVSSNNHLKFHNTSVEFVPIRCFDNWHNSQGGAVYEDYLFSVMACDEIGDNEENAFIWDLNRGIKVAGFNLCCVCGIRSFYKPHANEVCLGHKTDDAEFPLLYVSQSFGVDYGIIDKTASGVLVYKIEKSHIGYCSEIVQTIEPDLSDTSLLEEIGFGIHNYVVDVDDDILYILGYDNSYEFNALDSIHVVAFNLPNVEDKNVVLTNNMILDSYKIPMSYVMQSVFYDNGFLYILNGDSGNYKWMRSLNLKTKLIESKVDFTLLRGEPQFIGYWNNRLIMYFAGDDGLLFQVREPWGANGYQYPSLFKK